jgi:predicted proteasome-type protease
MDKLQDKAPNDLTDYRIVKLSDGSTLVGSISIDKEFLRIQNPLQLISTPRMTEQGVKEDNTLAPWVPFTNDKMFVIPKDRVMVISRAAKELANYYDVILTKLQHTKIKAAYSTEEIEKMLQIADDLDAELREREEIEEAELEYEDIDIKTIH